MSSIEIVLIMVAAVIASGYLNRLTGRFIPLPLFQILLGGVIAGVFNQGVRLQPDVFFLMFLPPLLFLDGWRIPKDGLLRDWPVILRLALGLVLFTVVAGGFLIHWLIPTLPVAVAFALAAVLSPTDPVAVASLQRRTKPPKRLQHILAGESLLNDASGLVCFQVALTAVATGGFAILDATRDFFVLIVMGIAAGLAVTVAAMFAQQKWVNRFGEDGSSPILLSLLIPFLAYLLAEQLGGSGILAAVAAGIAMSYADIGGKSMARTRIERGAIWTTVQFTLNGGIFVLLGEQLPSLAAQAVVAVRESGHFSPWWLAVFAVGITLALVLLRFGWIAGSVWLSYGWHQWQEREKGRGTGSGGWLGGANQNGRPEETDQKEDSRPEGDAGQADGTGSTTSQPVMNTKGLASGERPNWRVILTSSLTGVRGAVTLAAALAIPFTMGNGHPFPGRNLVIFLAASVILLSLIMSTLALPYVMRGLKDEAPGEHQQGMSEEKARQHAAKAGIAAVRKAEETIKRQGDILTTGLESDIASRVISVYQRRLHEESAEISASDLHRVNAMERGLRLAGLAGERVALIRMFKQKAISDEAFHSLLQELDMLEAIARKPE